jgi:hypothetical protein
MSSPVSYDLQGQGGGIVLSGGESDTGNYRWIQVVNDTVLSAITSSTLNQDGNLVGITIPAGVGIGGRFSAITVTSGVVIAYYA